ncbi:MAG: hypothetical protein AAB134_05880 [Pseudomonadota bacterium]
MEFFATAEKIIDGDALQARLDIVSLPLFCASITQVLSHDGNEGEIYCTWGLFFVRREPIRGGVRFTLPKCPNTIAWTITIGLPPIPEKIVVHLTINRTEHDPEFIDTIRAFMENWRQGLETQL